MVQGLSRARPGNDRRSLIARPDFQAWMDVALQAGDGATLLRRLSANSATSDTEAVRELAGLRFAREQVQASAVTGSTPRAAEDLVRVGRLISRLEATLRQVKAAKRGGQKMSIPEYLAWRDAQRDVQA